MRVEIDLDAYQINRQEELNIITMLNNQRNMVLQDYKLNLMQGGVSNVSGNSFANGRSGMSCYEVEEIR